MNGYALSRAFWNWAFENPDKNTPTHAAMFLWFVEKWNRCGQKTKISITTSETMEATGIGSRNTFSKVFKELQEYGFIKIERDSQNQYSSKIISLAQNLCKHEASTDTALDKALIQQGSEHEASTITINKQDNKETIKQDNNINDEQISEKKKKEKKSKPHLFSESEYINFENFQVAFIARFPELATQYDLLYYHTQLKNWEHGGKAKSHYKKIDWIITAKVWMEKNPPNGGSVNSFQITPTQPVITTKRTLGDFFKDAEEANRRMKEKYANIQTETK